MSRHKPKTTTTTTAGPKAAAPATPAAPARPRRRRGRGPADTAEGGAAPFTPAPRDTAPGLAVVLSADPPPVHRPPKLVLSLVPTGDGTFDGLTADDRAAARVLLSRTDRDTLQELGRGARAFGVAVVLRYDLVPSGEPAP